MHAALLPFALRYPYKGKNNVVRAATVMMTMRSSSKVNPRLRRARKTMH